MTALAASAQLGGTERVLLDFAAHAFEYDIALRVLAPRDGPLIDILNRIGVPTAVVPAPDAMLRGSQQPGKLWSALPAAMALPIWSRALRAHPFCADAHILYSIGFKTHLSTTFPLEKRVVWHLHEFPPETTGRFWKMLARRVPHALIANSEAVAAAWFPRRLDGQTVRRLDTSRAGLQPSNRLTVQPSGESNRIAVVRNGVNLDRFKPRPRTGWIHNELGIPPGARLIGMPAVFARWKGHELVVEAFRAIADEFPDVHLVFVGGSIYDTVAERQFGVELIRITGPQFPVPSPQSPAPSPQSPAPSPQPLRIHLLPFQSKIELAYPEFDLAIHYSLRPEPFGRVILEAMACGVPLIAAAEGGPLEILGVPPGEKLPSACKPAIGGWLVPPRSARDLADAMRHILGLSAEELRRVGALGRTRAEDHFSARGFARGVADVLKVTFDR